MRAFLIDPAERTLTSIEFEGDFRKIGELIGCDIITAARINDLGDVIYVDDEGLMKGQASFFLVEGYPQPLAGRGLLVGTDVEPTVTEQWLRDNLDFGTPMQMGSLLMFVGDRHMREIQ